MSATLKITEGAPASYPQVVAPTPADGSQLQMIANTAWQRVEAYIAHRWGSRSIEYIADGPGSWQPRLTPTTITSAEIWRDGAWAPVTLAADPFGGYNLDAETYCFTGTCGSDDEPPRAVKSAVFRLIEYFLAVDETPRDERPLRSFSYERRGVDPLASVHSPAPDQGVSFERTGATWVSRALQHSGAADLLRPFRNLGSV